SAILNVFFLSFHRQLGCLALWLVRLSSFRLAVLAQLTYQGGAAPSVCDTLSSPHHRSRSPSPPTPHRHLAAHSQLTDSSPAIAVADTAGVDFVADENAVRRVA